MNFKRIDLKQNQPIMNVDPANIDNVNENAYLMEDEINM